MYKLITLIACLTISISMRGLSDTIIINGSELLSTQIPLGKTNYLIYAKKDQKSPIRDLTFIEMNVSKHLVNGKSQIKIVQKWYEKDTVSHFAETTLLESNLSTMAHETWWKRTGQNMKFDFETKSATITGTNAEAKNVSFQENFLKSLNSPNFINWHCDLHLFGLLPFKEGAIFKSKLFDPGFSLPRYEVYNVIKSEKLDGVDCWVLNYNLSNNMGYQKFWISKKDRIVIKEEDNFRGAFRYKLKTLVSE
jgi:hypothetical protein